MDAASGRWSARMAVVLALPFLSSAHAKAEVVLDPTFGVNGVVRTGFGSGYNDDPRDLLIQPDGQILTAGKSAAPDGHYIAISRHSADGVLDSTGFGVDGKVLTRFDWGDHANAIALQEDGKIVAVGMQMTSAGVSTQRQSVYRFRADGTVDTSFGNGGYVTEWGDYETGEKAGVKVLPDGRILTGGRRHPGYWGGVTGFSMRRYLPDGTLTMGGLIEFPIDRNRGSCAFPDDGGIVLANTREVGPDFYFVMARLDSLGNPDAGFGTGGVVETGIRAAVTTVLRVLVLSDGKILLVGTTHGVGGQHQWTALRFNSDGTPDDLFGTNGRTDVSFGPGAQDQCYDAAVYGDGRILLAGKAHLDYYNDACGLVRLLPDGSLDSTFSDDGKFADYLGYYKYFTRVLILPDGRILTAGLDYSSGDWDFFLARFWPSDVTGVDVSDAFPTRLSIHASPNPSHAGMTIWLQLPREQVVNVGIFDVSGRAVRRVFDGPLSAGMRLIPWDGRDDAGREVSSGVYFTRVSTSEESRSAKLLLLRR